MASDRLDELRSQLAPIRLALLDHPVYGRIDGIGALRTFMEYHVFAVWDFMSLLKALQRRLCCVEVPWTPPTIASLCRAVNEIVLGEECDDDGRGGHSSHFDLYRTAMRRCGASTEIIDRLVEHIRAGLNVASALETAGAPPAVQEFVRHTFTVIDGGDACAIASSFALGREDLLPDVFRRIVDELDGVQQTDLGDFRYYLDRHIELDGGQHGSMASMLVEELCGDDRHRWRVAEDAALDSLRARLELWNCIGERLKPPLSI
jgi:Protein of unknown function (DUF3050)